MARTTFEPDRGGAYWIVLTPSADDAAWRREITRAAREAGLICLELSGGYDTQCHEDEGLVLLTDDAAAPVTAGAGSSRAAAIIPDPGSSFEALEDRLGIVAPQSVWHASMLLSRALALSPSHRVVTANDLGQYPATITLFDRIRLTPPQSTAEISRRPAVHAAFAVYRAAGPQDDEPILWADRLFTYDERATRGSTDWGVLDTTGRPRMLLFGPYLALPPGRWRARMRFGFDENAAGHQYRVDWGTRTACISEYVTPGAPGIYEIDLDFEWTESDASEIRLILTEGSFMGTVLFQGMTVQRTPGPGT